MNGGNTLFDENSVSEALMVGVRLIIGGCDVISGTISSTAASVSSDSSSLMLSSSSSSALLQVFDMSNLSARITMFIAGVICLGLMLTSNTVVATQELTPLIFSDNYIDLNSCDFSQPKCNHDSFKNSGSDT